MVTLLGAEEIAALKAAPFTYAEVGATAGPDLPVGYQHLRRERTLHSATFDAAADGVRSWLLQERSGLTVAASDARVEPGTVVRLRFGPGPLALRIPCRVVYVVDEPDRAGFAYGTLPGHPECGEESFVVERRGDATTVVITAFSKPATMLARLEGPVSRRVQSVVTDRYLRALDGS